MTQEEQIRRARSLSQSWRTRPDFIGDIVQENPKLYNMWRSIRFTEKGKRAGCKEEWHKYRDFYNCVSGGYFPECKLVRKDRTKPWGSDNYMFITKDDFARMSDRVFVEYNGEKLSLKQWAEKLGVSYQGLKIRYYRHRKEYTAEELLFGIRKARGSKQAKDITDSGVKIRAKASKMIYAYRVKDRSNGCELCDMDIDWMIENILSKPCHYCGDTRRIGCDRLDNKKGHTKDNVVPCCIECNTARNNYFTYEEMRKLGRAIAEIKRERNGKT